MNKDLGRLIQSDSDLARVCECLVDSRRLALDTEFERSRTFYVRPALIQLCDGSKIHLVDPLKINGWDPLVSLLEDPAIPIIVHSASEDLEVFERLWGSLPKSLFDTQIAASLLGLGYSLSYRGLVQRLCDIDLPKSETRSNWLRRPLSSAQLEYARMDVVYLPAIYDRLDTALESQGRSTWMNEECARLLARHHENQDVEQAYLRFERSAKLGPRELGVLRALAAWREHEARKRDRPRGFVLRDDVLLAIAKQMPATLPELHDVMGTGITLKQRDATVMLRIVARVMSLDTTKLPSPLPSAGALRGHTGTIKALRELVSHTAQELDIAPEVLAHRRALEDLTREVLVEKHLELTGFFAGWRSEVIGDRLLEHLLARETG